MEEQPLSERLREVRIDLRDKVSLSQDAVLLECILKLMEEEKYEQVHNVDSTIQPG